MPELSKEIEGRLAQYKRLLLSYADFKHAKLASSYILSERLHEKCNQQGYVLLEALNCSMIIGYCRPFSGNEGRVPDLPHRFLRELTSAERIVHDAVMVDRDKVLAHSEAEALQLEPVRWQVAGRELVVPLKNWGLAPLTAEATAIFSSAAGKLLAAVVEKRRVVEPELTPYMRIANPENPFEYAAEDGAA